MSVVIVDATGGNPEIVDVRRLAVCIYNMSVSHPVFQVGPDGHPELADRLNIGKVPMWNVIETPIATYDVRCLCGGVEIVANHKCRISGGPIVKRSDLLTILRQMRKMLMECIAVARSGGDLHIPPGLYEKMQVFPIMLYGCPDDRRSALAAMDLTYFGNGDVDDAAVRVARDTRFNVLDLKYSKTNPNVFPWTIGPGYFGSPSIDISRPYYSCTCATIVWCMQPKIFKPEVMNIAPVQLMPTVFLSRLTH